MEKRLLLAFLVSFGFLSLWGIIVPSQSPRISPPQDLQRPDNKEVMSFSRDDAKSAFTPTLAINAPLTAEFTEELTILENEKLRVELTNAGGAIKKIQTKDYDADFPVSKYFQFQGLESVPFSMIEKRNDGVTYKYDGGDFVVRKSFSLASDTNLIFVSIEVEYVSAKKEFYVPRMDVFRLDATRLDKNLSNSRDLTLYEYAFSMQDEVYRKSNFLKFSKEENGYIISKLDKKETQKKLDWIGIRNRYFCLIVKPQYPANRYGVNKNTNQTADFYIDLKADDSQKNKIQFENILYAGPQDLKRLQAYHIGIENFMVFSNWGLFDAVAKGIYHLLIFLHRLIPNWGVCILLIGGLIYGATYPLSMKGLKSAKRMQLIQPEMKRLQDQYKNNPQRLQKETAELMKKHKINPLGGCLPLFLQLPIFIGLYQVLWRSVSLKGSKFLWIQDLSEPDRLVVLSNQLPFIGNEINLLPLLMCVIMFFQQKLSANSMPSTDPAQKSQQQMMLIMFPVMMLVFFYKAASGLTLYFTLLYLLTTLTQWKMSKMKLVDENGK